MLCLRVRSCNCNTISLSQHHLGTGRHAIPCVTMAEPALSLEMTIVPRLLLSKLDTLNGLVTLAGALDVPSE